MTPQLRSSAPSWETLTSSVAAHTPEHGAPSSVDNSTRLDDDLRESIRRSVDEHEVAVLLESAGISDRVAAEEFDAPDVFDLAIRLRSEFGRRSRDPAPERNDWYVTSTTAALRGCLFTVAGLSSVGLAAIGKGRSAGLWILVGCAVWVAILQGVSFLAYLLIERGAAKSRDARVFPMVGLFGAAAIAGVVTGIVTDPAVGGLMGVALSSLTAIVLLLVVERTLVASAVVLPIGGIAIVAIVNGPVATDVAIALWVVGGLLLTVATILILGWRWRPTPVPLSGPDLRAAVPFAVVGLGAGALSLSVAAAASSTTVLGGASTGVWLVATSPFLIPVSLAEALVVGLRRHLLLMTARVPDRASLRVLARSSAIRTWSMQVALAGLLVIGAGITLSVSGIHGGFPDMAALLIQFALLGTSLTAALLLVSCERAPLAAAIMWGAAAGVTFTALATGSPAAQVVVLAAGSIVAVVRSSDSVGRAGSYR